jgi:hypothetical protein
MNGHVGAMTIDRTPVSASELARMHAEEALHAEWQSKAVRVVAASSLGAEDCRLLLSILGLDAQLIADSRRATSCPVERKSARKRRAQVA